LLLRQNVRIRNDKNLRIEAIELRQQGNNGRYQFNGSVQFWQDTMQAKGEGGLYDSQNEILWVFGNAQASDENQVLNGDIIEINLRNNTISARGDLRGQFNRDTNQLNTTSP
jgi:lipopolysaccharide export system protein LptA